MGRSAAKKLTELMEEYTGRWQQWGTFISNAVNDKKITPELERDFILLSADLAQRTVPLARLLNLEKSFIRQVIDLLEDIYNLHVVLGMQQFQITLLKERWNSVQLEINSRYTRKK